MSRHKQVIAGCCLLAVSQLCMSNAKVGTQSGEGTEASLNTTMVALLKANDTNKAQMSFAHSSQLIQFAYNNAFVFNPRTLRWHAYDSSGRVVNTGHAVGGNHYCRDIRRSCRTPTGTYTIWSKGGAGCRSSRYPLGRGGAIMSHCMFFTKNHAIHGSNDLPGYNASHGCIRVSKSAARWLNTSFVRPGSTRVVVLPY